MRLLSELGAAFASLVCLASAATAQDAASSVHGPGWPAGDFAEEAGYFCSACHSLGLVEQQGMSRERWDEILDWMTEKQNMPPLEGEEREAYLDLLAANFGPDPRGGSDGPTGASRPGLSIRPAPMGQGVTAPALSIRPRE